MRGMPDPQVVLDWLRHLRYLEGWKPQTKICIVCTEPYTPKPEDTDDGICSAECDAQAREWSIEARADSYLADAAYDDWQRWKAEGNG